MPYYNNAQEFYKTMSVFFNRMQSDSPDTINSLYDKKISIKFDLSEPDSQITINAKYFPPKIYYGNSNNSPVELMVITKTDVLHRILMDELTLTEAIKAKSLEVRGPIWKTLSLKQVFDQGRSIYPSIASLSTKNSLQTKY